MEKKGTKAIEVFPEGVESQFFLSKNRAAEAEQEGQSPGAQEKSTRVQFWCRIVPCLSQS